MRNFDDGVPFHEAFGARTRPRIAFTCGGQTGILTIRQSPVTIHSRSFRSSLLPKRGCSSMVERQLPKLHTRVRFPSPAYLPIKMPLNHAKIGVGQNT